MESSIREFNPIQCPLKGTCLIEASAGTGKTYTITSLFLRLVIEKKLKVSEILVVTFTKAATEELRDRIRRRLRAALQGLYSGCREDDEFIDALVRRQSQKEISLKLVEQALRDFDEAAIFTIHGFCQKVLFENAFETAQYFDSELITDEKGLLLETTYDFWRKFFVTSQVESLDYFLKKGIKPETFFALADFRSKHPEVFVVPETEEIELTQLPATRELFEQLKRNWSKSKDEIRDILTNATLKGHSYGTTIRPDGHPSTRELLINEMFLDMDMFLSQPWPCLPVPKTFNKFTSRYLADHTKKSGDPPKHDFFVLCEQFREQAGSLERELDKLLVYFQRKFLEFSSEDLSRKKELLNQRTFSDLIRSVQSSLADTKGSILQNAIRKRYKAALIDEFQDTDPLQYAIFKQVFGDDQFPLFLIGDPKQAIYGFRGAEIFTYMDAAKNIQEKYTLSKNWRSTKGMVSAVNALFSSQKDPFIFRQIPFVQGQPREKNEPSGLIIDGTRSPSLNLWFIEYEAKRGKGMPKQDAKGFISDLVASEIARLLHLGMQGRAYVGGEPLSGRHVAVLVKQNRDAIMIQRALARLNVHSVIYSGDNLFDTREAEQVERLLWAICEPENEAYVRAALITDIIGMTCNDLSNLIQDDRRWDKRISLFKEYARLWEQNGFMAMFHNLMVQEDVKQHLLCFPDGERRLTNILHLCEVLHKRAIEENLNPAALLKWLIEQRDKKAPRVEEHQLRLETDQEAVKVLTIHKSKGLEFSIVFCPFAWDPFPLPKNARKDPYITFHDQEKGKLTLVLGKEGTGLYTSLADREIMAENMRLFYVALTRAKACCYLAWGNISGAELSPLAYLICGPDSDSCTDVVRETANAFAKTLGELEARLRDLADRSGGEIALIEPVISKVPLPPTQIEPDTLNYRPFSGAIATDWKIISFSSIVSDQDTEVSRPGLDEETFLAPDMDIATLSEAEQGQTMEFISFPKGAKAGTFVHSLLEDLDFTDLNSLETKDLILERLDNYGFGKEWFDAIYQMLNQLLEVQLDPEYPSLVLKALSKEMRLNELEFYFPLQSIAPQRLNDIFHSPPTKVPLAFKEQIGHLTFSPTRGFMKGFMDMVFRWGDRFYLVDWKSNFLGPTIEFYHQRELEAAMAREFYFFQYHIYCVALDQYLRQRVPGYDYETHFGRVYYIFLRGVDSRLGYEYGIFRDRPSEELIHELSEALIGS